ncbi:hypothetical protein CKK33_15525 [Mucilaginibacter sp. MD40]|uniref:gliding motility-associated C-terminal domain-containing protein n=1 Tax=Mucilaginibacter sp. MD40 TaxID=2029590 RepID=UPI000BACA243|nr:gliding motility-associated C-terminal domain-containing protein [Mucilaginibacter sp. MD40]PAW94826.1 hypothetical protein CKK33_15525 [Mucilaginibacter sp. MD40]
MTKPYNNLNPKALVAFGIILFLSCLHIALHAQSFYVCTSNFRLQKVTFTPNGLQTQQVEGCGNGTFFSIAVDNTKLYYNDINAGLYSADLVTTGNTTTVTNCKYITSAPGNALTVGKDGVYYVYGYGTELMVVNPATGAAKSLGVMPYGPSGDLVFYNNELYMANYAGIVKIPLNDPSKAFLWLPIPDASIYGLATVKVGNLIKAYAFTGVSGGTNVLELDLNKRQVVGSIGTLPYVVYDAGSPVETAVEPPLQIKEVKVTRDCDKPNKGTAEVVTDVHASEYTYTLNNGASNTTGLFTNLAPGNYTVTVKAEGQPEKVQGFTIPDYNLTAPTIVPVLVNPVCDIKGSIQLKISTNGYRIKYNNALYDSGYLFADLLPGAYHFTIVNEQGCVIDEKDYTLVQNVCPPITITAINVDAECKKYGLAVVNVSTLPHPDKYSYTLAGTTNIDGTFTDLLPGTYKLVIVSSADKKETTVVVPDFKIVNKPNLLPVVKNAICTANGNIKFMPNGDIKGAAKVLYNNTTYKIGQLIPDLPVGSYHFTILTEQDCILDEVDLQVNEDKCDPVDFPNAFTPNNDGANDIFRPNQDSNPIKYSMMVFARNGQQMFQTNNILLGWDGTFKGAAVPAGVYYWVCTYTMGDFVTVSKKGWVTLVR